MPTRINLSLLNSCQLLFFLFALAFSCSTPHNHISLPSSFPTNSQVTEQLADIVNKAGIPGISVSIIRHGQQFDYSAGLADVEEDVQLTENHRMPLGSIGKTFVAAGLLQLADEGKLSLDDQVQNHLSTENWFTVLPNADAITIRQLMNHTSGVPEYVYEPALWESLKSNPDKSWTVADRMQYIAGADAHFAAGSGWSYADANYIILGAILEKVSGKEFYQFLEGRFVNPLKLTQTSPAVQREIHQLAAGYTGNFFADMFTEKIATLGEYTISPQLEWAGGGWISSAHDLAIWAETLYAGQTLPAQALQQMHTPVNRQTGQPDDWGYGLGKEIFATRYGKAYGHTGFMPGFQSFMAYLPEQQLSLAFQINMDPFNSKLKRGTSVFTLADQILSIFLADQASQQPTTTVYLVRHAEKASDGSRDPALTSEGQARAGRLAELLANEDVSGVYSTNFKRTRDTAQPVAEQFGLEVNIYSPFDLAASLEMVARHAGKTILIVGHSNSTPAIVNFLLRQDQVEQLDESEYDKLFQLDYHGPISELTISSF